MTISTDGKLTFSVDKEIWRKNGSKEPYRIPKVVDGVTISTGTDNASNAVQLTSTLSVMVEGPNGDIGFYGYDGVPTKQYPKGTPIPLKAMAREYGTSSGEQKKPFFRKAFAKKEIEQAMMEVQNRYIEDDGNE